MRGLKLAGVGLLLLSASCSFQVGTDSGSGSRAPSSQARRAPPPPPPPPPRSAPRPAPAPAPAPAPVPAPVAAQTSAVAPAGPAIMAINISKLQQIRARNPKPCGFVEVAPGNWVHVNCDQYKPSAKAISHLSPRKLQMLKAKKTTFKPIAKTAALQEVLRRNRYGNGAANPPAGTGAGPTPTGGPVQIGEDFPKQVDHRAEGLESPIKNQGQVGSCTAHSLSAALDNAAIRAGALKAGDRDRMTSPLHVWSRYGLPDMGAAADSNIAQPVGIFQAWPQSEREACMMFMDTGSYADECGDALNVKPGSWRSDSALMAKYNKSQAEGIYKIASIEKLQVKPPNIDELLSILASGADIWAAFTIDFPAWSNSGMKNAVIPNYTRTAGGHAVVLSGYRETDSGRQFLIHNSWGESWGDKGFAWIPEQTLTQRLYHAYKVKITNGVKKEELTDDDCAPDELVDLGTGLCAVMCFERPDGADLRPTNGCKK